MYKLLNNKIAKSTYYKIVTDKKNCQIRLLQVFGTGTRNIFERFQK